MPCRSPAARCWTTAAARAFWRWRRRRWAPPMWSGVDIDPQAVETARLNTRQRTGCLRSYAVSDARLDHQFHWWRNVLAGPLAVLARHLRSRESGRATRARWYPAAADRTDHPGRLRAVDRDDGHRRTRRLVRMSRTRTLRASCHRYRAFSPGGPYASDCSMTAITQVPAVTRCPHCGASSVRPEQ